MCILNRDQVSDGDANKLPFVSKARNTRTFNLSNKQKFRPVFKTKRFCDTFITLMPSKPKLANWNVIFNEHILFINVTDMQTIFFPHLI